MAPEYENTTKKHLIYLKIIYVNLSNQSHFINLISFNMNININQIEVLLSVRFVSGSF